MDAELAASLPVVRGEQVAIAGGRDGKHASDARTSALPEDQALLQSRVGRFGLVAGMLGFASLLFRVPAYVLHSHFDWSCFFEPSMAWHELSVVILLGGSLFASGKPRAVWVLRLVEAGAVIGSCFAYGAMGRALFFLKTAPHMADTGLSPAVVGLIVNAAMSYTVLARAVFVPSSPMRTGVVTLLAGGGFFFVVGVSSGGVDSFGYRNTVFGAGIGHLLWWSLSVGLAVAASRVIFGLRKEARMAQQYGQYTLAEKIGEGGMGVVYRARHALLRRPTALKLLPPERMGRLSLDRFEREVQLTATLTHPNTVRVFDYGRTPEGIFYYAMEFLDGETLQDIVDATGPMPPARVAHVLRQVAGALVEAHDAGLIHRDLKPANVMLCTQGGIDDFAKLLDLGLAHDAREPKLGKSRAVDRGDRGDRGGTERTVSVDAQPFPSGTPLYLAPEAIQANGQVTARSDLYALGAVAYFLLTGREVFSGATSVEVFAKHVWSPPELPSTLLPLGTLDDARARGLELLIMSCLEKEPAARPESARELLGRLDESGIPAWKEADAHAFWTARATVVRAHRQKQLAAFTPPAHRTLAIDFAGRG